LTISNNGTREDRRQANPFSLGRESECFKSKCYRDPLLLIEEEIVLVVRGIREVNPGQ